MCINWTKQLNWGCYFVSGVKTDMSYIAVNEVKSTTIKTEKGGASPCNPNIRVTLFSRGLWSKLNLNQRVRWLVEDSVGWDHWARGGTFCECWLAFFSCREILNHLPNTRPWSPLFWFRSHHIYPDKRLMTVPLYCFSLPTMFDHGRRWCDRGVWPWCVISSWPWYMVHGYKINVFC